MSEHRRRPALSRRGARRRHRTIARGGKAGVLAAALLTTSAAAVLAVVPTLRSDTPPAVAETRDGRTRGSLLSGLHEFLATVETGAPHRSSGDSGKSPESVPQNSGAGRRVVFDQSEQRVWIVGRGGRTRSTHRVSGSEVGNLDPGRYRVYSRSRHAVGFDYHSTMDYFVRFARGENAAIGFHDIPEDRSGKPVQTIAQLGTPQSAGCIRQKEADAKAMWRFATIDTSVVVVE